ncbi:transposase [Streptomyces sp. NPDC093681]|uniref:transposase n=1 Tax=Streptomyces sp. NPDC093681 TaxID=3155202 RepID=UPI00343A2C41
MRRLRHPVHRRTVEGHRTRRVGHPTRHAPAVRRRQAARHHRRTPSHAGRARAPGARPGRARAEGRSDREPRPRRRATYTRPHGVRHLFAAYDLARDKLYGHVKPKKNRTRFLEFCRYLRSLYPPKIRIAIVLNNFSPHLTTKKDSRVGDWAAANNVELAYTPTNSSWLNRIEAQFTALRYFALDGTDHASHKEQGSMIRRYIIWRNRHAADQRLRAVVDRANIA